MNFTSWLNSTLELQVKSYGQDPRELTGPELMDFIRWNTLAATDELHEALQETGWKPWATSQHLNRDEFIGEMVDALHFIANLLCAASCTGEELSQRYVAKQRRNAERQIEGYTGVDSKCPTCRRDFGDLLEKDTLAAMRFRTHDGVKYCSVTCANAGADC